jgi:ribosomal protein S18 acetylase RimI-like enzyme
METRKLALRRLGQDDVEHLIPYLEGDRLNNLFHLANLDQLGIDHPELRYFGAFHPDDAWAGELMLFRTSAGVFWQDRRVLPLFKDIILRERTSAISGQKNQVDPLLNLLPDAHISQRIDATFAAVSAGDLRPWPERGERVATLDDVDLLTDLYARNLLFGRLDRDKHRARVESVLTTGGIITLAERDGLAVSAARTSAIGHGMAIIGGVMTLPAYRRMGFARACTGLLSQQLIERGVESCLNYDRGDLAASRTYQGLGYRTIGSWTIAFLDA